ncbi:MAG: hypothetical protein DLM58_08550 [Pseudonocardiales bacterium]|nr:MAG: hypothetical protein DLM58_08550 [Pseudonocardiales bacterium]
MNVNVRRYVWYRFRSTFKSRRGGYAALALVVALLGGTAMAAIAAGRRTQSSYPAFLASTQPTDLVASLFDITSATGLPSTYSAALADKVARLPGVTRSETAISLNAVPLRPDGSPVPRATSDVAALGSITGLYFDVDRPAVVNGRMADPRRADEFVMSVDASRLLGFRVGQVIPFAFYTNAAVESGEFGTPAVRPLVRIGARLVGLVAFNTEIVQDDVDRLLPPILFSPALTARILPLSPDSTGATQFGLNVVGGTDGVAAVQREFLGLVPPGSGSSFRVTSAVESKVEAAVQPESIALGAFGAFVGIAAILIAILMIGRQLRADDQALRVLRALGADPAMTGLDGVLGVLGAASIGVVLAGVAAVALSPLSPLGPVRSVYPGGGIAADWSVLGAGTALLWGAVMLATVMLGYRSAPHRVAARSLPGRRSAITTAAANAGLPAPAVVGVRFALESGEGSTAVPVRSALVGAVASVAVVVATLTFGSGLRTLVANPPLYGWNWDYVLSSTNIVPPQATAQLDHDADVAAWSGYFQTSVQFDGRTVPVLMGGVHAAVAPPILSGHQVDADDEIVLGPATLAELHRHVGDTVVATYGRRQDAPIYIPPTVLKIVGTTSLPAISKPSTGQDHLTIGRGAVVSTGLVPASFQAVFQNPDPTLNGPELALVRLRPTLGTAEGLADMRRIADAANTAFATLRGGAAGNNVVVLPVERPAQIANYRSMRTAPVLLAAGLAAGVAIALAFVTSASVRQRRRDLAIMKALGFTRSQLQAAVACQASVPAAAGVLFGVPLGIAAGRWLWREFAQQIYVVPDPSIPWLSVLLVIVGAAALANLAAALPGRSAATTPMAIALRSE